MPKEFDSLKRLAHLKDDAKQAAAIIAEADNQEGDGREPQTKELHLDSIDSTPTQHTSEQRKPVNLSTLAYPETKERLRRAAHLQAANKSSPDSQWEIVDQAINDWCDKHNY